MNDHRAIRGFNPYSQLFDALQRRLRVPGVGEVNNLARAVGDGGKNGGPVCDRLVAGQRGLAHQMACTANRLFHRAGAGVVERAGLPNGGFTGWPERHGLYRPPEDLLFAIPSEEREAEPVQHDLTKLFRG